MLLGSFDSSHSGMEVSAQAPAAFVAHYTCGLHNRLCWNDEGCGMMSSVIMVYGRHMVEALIPLVM